jgi:hypothetical protein
MSAWYHKVSHKTGWFKVSETLTSANTEWRCVRYEAIGGHVYMSTCNVQVCLRINLWGKNKIKSSFTLLYWLFQHTYTFVYTKSLWRFNEGIVSIYELLVQNTQQYPFSYWHLQNSLTQLLKVSSEKPIIAHQVKKCSQPYKALNLCMIFKNTFRWSLSLAKWSGKEDNF